MANLVVSARFTLNDAPATGLTLADIDLYLYRVNKSTGVWSTVWSGQNPDTEAGGGVYSLLYGSADFDTYDYWHYGHYTGTAANVDVPYSYGDGQHDGLTGEAITDITALNNLSAQQVWEYATRTLTAFGFSASISEATAQSIADQVLRRSVTNVEDEAERDNLAQIILATFESSIDNDTGVWTIRKKDGSTYETKQATLDEEAIPVTGVT
jgi:hypothetical protein